MPIPKNILGQYSYVDKLKNSDKVWICEMEPDGTYTTSWGRRGATLQSKEGLDEVYVIKKVMEKIAKGYLRTGGEISPVAIPAPRRAARVSKPKPEKSSGDKLYPPSRCTSTLPADLNDKNLIAEEKLDGARYVLYIGHDPYGRQSNNALLSRRVSVVDQMHVDRTDNVPHFTKPKYAGLKGTVLDGEVMGPDFLNTSAVLNSNPDKAVAKQGSKGKLYYHAFDIMAYLGEDVTNLPLSERRKLLEKVVKKMGNKFVKCIPQIKKDFEKYFKSIVAAGGEGLIIKDVRLGYGAGWSKWKKVYDVSTIVTGWKPGNGQYSDQIGSLAVSVYHEGKLVEVGFASGFSDKLRRSMSDDFEAIKGSVLDVFCQEIQKSKRSSGNGIGRLRHPTFHRFRDDLEPKTITSKKLLNDLKAGKTRNNRNKK